jgi:hypothetical protein
MLGGGGVVPVGVSMIGFTIQFQVLCAATIIIRDDWIGLDWIGFCRRRGLVSSHARRLVLVFLSVI